MNDDHPNVALIQKLDPGNLAGEKDLFAEDFVWHYFNLLLPDLAGDYVGVRGLQSFFDKLGSLTDGTFRVNPISVTAIGDELVVVHSLNQLTIEGRSIETHVVVVWRIVDGRIAEVWDIPSVHSAPNKET